MSSYLFSRRSLLASAGLASAFVPLLGARRGFAAPRSPRRLVILQWTNGIINKAWWPTGGEYDFVLPETLRPLEALRKDVIVVGKVGLRNQADSKVPGAGVGHQSLWALLTGADAALGRNGGGPCGVGNAISVDQYVAKALVAQGPTKFSSLEVGGMGVSASDNERAISYRGPAVGGRPADNPPQIDPYKTWDKLFKDLPSMPGAGTPGMTSELFAKIRAERKSILDFVASELGGVRAKLGSDDAKRLDEHLTSVRKLEEELTANAGTGSSGAACSPQPLAAGMPQKGVNIDKIIPTQMDLILTAMRCDLTRVATLMMCGPSNDGIYFPFLGSDFASSGKYLEGDHHGIAHAGGPKKAAVDQWWMKQLAYLLGKLKSTPEGGGTMLDNTLVVMANNMDNGGSHGTGGGVPFLLAGSVQGYFKTGRYVTGHKKETPHNQILVAIANAMLDGLEPPLKSFGEPSFGGELPGLRG